MFQYICEGKSYRKPHLMLAGNLGIDGSFHSLHFASPALLGRASSSYFCVVASAKLSEHTFTQGTDVQTDGPGHPATQR